MQENVHKLLKTYQKHAENRRKTSKKTSEKKVENI